MAQAEEKTASIGSQILFQTPAPEVYAPQVQVAEAAMEEIMKDDSQLSSKKLRKLFNKGKLNARFTEELRSVKAVKANIDASLYRNYRTNF